MAASDPVGNRGNTRHSRNGEELAQRVQTCRERNQDSSDELIQCEQRRRFSEVCEHEPATEAELALLPSKGTRASSSASGRRRDRKRSNAENSGGP